MTKKALDAPDMERIAGLRPLLEHAADQLNSKIIAFEAELNSLKLGVAAKVAIWSDHENEEGEYLHFKKYHQKWRLLTSYEDASDDPVEEVPLIGAPRETRILAVSLFPVLLASLVEKSEQELVRLSEAGKAVDALMAAMREHK